VASVTPAPARVATAAGPKPAAAGQAPSSQFTTAAGAQARCPKDPVVWANARAKAYHVRGDKYYAKTKYGAYMCERDAIQRGFHTALLPPKREMTDTTDSSAAGAGGPGGGDKGLEFRLRNSQ
jgi:hypothetical protein